MIDLTRLIQITLDSIETKNTRTAYGLWLDRFEKWYSIAAKGKPITYDLVIEYMATLKGEYNNPSLALALAAAKKMCYNAHQADRETVGLLTWLSIKDISPAKLESLPSGQMIPLDDIEKLLDDCKADDKPAGVRDAAIIAVLHATGMRRDECANLRMSDYDSTDCKFTLRRTKGKKDRPAYLNEGATYHLEKWLDLRGYDSGPIFWRARRNGELWTGKGMSGAAIRKILLDRCSQAGVRPYNPHDFRRTLISNLLNQENDAILVARIAGHKNVATTMRYDMRDDARMKEAIRGIETPYRKETSR